MGTGAPLADVLAILSRLRNTVHGQAIQATMRLAESGTRRSRCQPEHESQVLASMDNLGDAVPGVPSQASAELWQLIRASSWNSCSLPFCGC